MIEFRIEVANLHSHHFRITMRVAKPMARQRLRLPVWIPGSYLVREFARHLSPLSAHQGEKPCQVTPVDKMSWDVDTDGRGALTVRYDVYAFDTSVRAAFLDSQRGFFNGTSVFLQAEGFEHFPQRMTLAGLPRGWQVATSMPALKVNAQGIGLYEAPNYDALIDHPVEMGDFRRGEFTVRGVRHEFVVSGASADLDLERLLADTRRICEAQISFWHGRRKPDFKHYVFMLHAVEDGYGGLEHRQSTALICSRKDLPRLSRPTPTDGYQTLLGLISHEYFHTWNVKRLKPNAFAPYDLTTENHTRMLWFFEGFTSYYDDQFLLRTGLIDAATYLKLVTKTINQVLATPGRLQYSVGQASFDAWTRYYRPDENTANATVSYYTKGALVGLCLDLTLRLLPVTESGQPSLDAVMKSLWALQRPINESDVAVALHEVAGAIPDTEALRSVGVYADSWDALLHNWTECCDELPLQQLLSTHGVRWLSKAAPLPQRLGVRLTDAQGVVKVQAVMRGSAAEATGLSAGDECLALDGWRLRRSDDLAQWHDAQRSQPLLVCRDQRLLTLNLQSLKSVGYIDDIMALNLADVGADDVAFARRESWLGCK
jgi:predicted metalloprotease with PDZ domain